MGEGSVKRDVFSIILQPHRSLSAKGFKVMLICAGSLSLIVGLVFTVMGAWPILFFFGLQFLLLYGAFKLNYRSGRRFETIRIENHKLIVSFFAETGQEIQKWYQAYWSRVEMKEETLLILCGSERLVIGEFLIEEEKAEVREAVTAALYRYRNGVKF